MSMKELKWWSGGVALEFKKVLGSILSEVTAYSFFSHHFLAALWPP